MTTSLRRRLRELRILAKRAVGVEPRVRETLHPRLEYHGNREGGWKIVADSLRSDSVVVDVGLGEDLSFSESIIEKYGCVVHGFDPTPRAIAYVSKRGNPRLRLFDVGVGSAPGKVEFFLPQNPRHVSGSMTRERHLGQVAIPVTVVTVPQILEMVKSPRIDLLKLDIEGTEYDLIDSAPFQSCAGGIDQLCVEFHHRWKGRGKASTERAVRQLRSLGFECAWYCRATNEEFLFVRRMARLGDSV